MTGQMKGYQPRQYQKCICIFFQDFEASLSVLVECLLLVDLEWLEEPALIKLLVFIMWYDFQL